MNRGLSFAKDRPRTPAENSYRGGIRSQAHWAVSGAPCAGQSESRSGLRGMQRFLSFSYEKLRNRSTHRNKKHEDTFSLSPKTEDQRFISRLILRITIYRIHLTNIHAREGHNEAGEWPYRSGLQA